MKRALSGVQPSGRIHIGNYLGAIKHFVELQETYEGYYCVVDLHALTIPQEPSDLQRRIREVAQVYLACGLDRSRSVLFVQSDVPAHSQLAWILNCNAMFGELNRQTQFKDKARNKRETVSVGLFDYPVLMAADILLYQADVVPVGEDQKQHVELTRDIAQRFNGRYAPVFTVPEPIIPSVGARIMGLDDPTVKMSKSANSEWNYVLLTDPPDLVQKKFRRAVTDSGSEVHFDPENKPAVSNLLTIFSLFSGQSVIEIEDEYRSTGYARFKNDLADLAIERLRPIQDRLQHLDDEPTYLEKVLADGAQRAGTVADATLAKVEDAVGVGFVRRLRRQASQGVLP